MLPGVVISGSQVVLAGSPGLARPGAGGRRRVLPGLVPTSLFCLFYCHGPGSVAVWLMATRPRLGCCRTVPHGSLSLALPRSMSTASGRSRARRPACHPAPRGARRSRRPEKGPGAGAGVCVLTTEQDAAPVPSRQTSARPAITARPALHHLLHTLLHALGLRSPSAAAPFPPHCCRRLSM